MGYPGDTGRSAEEPPQQPQRWPPQGRPDTGRPDFGPDFGRPDSGRPGSGGPEFGRPEFGRYAQHPYEPPPAAASAPRSSPAEPESGNLYGSTGERYFEHDPQDEFVYGPPASPRGPRRPPRRRSRTLLAAASALAIGALLIGGGFGLSAMLRDDDPGTTGAAGQTASPQAGRPADGEPSPTPLGSQIRDRQADPRMLTRPEVFKRPRFTVRKQRYVRTATSAHRNCARLVNGGRLRAALRSGDCNQLLRASFRRADDKLIGTVGVANVRDEAAARAAVRAGNAKVAYLKPLPGQGASQNLGQGQALGSIEARGHYVLMTWVQRPDGKALTRRHHRAVTKFGRDVIYGSNLAAALQYRGITGKPHGT